MTSQINPNNIDGTYPVAGQPNNTQGFRDNFTNIKTNFSAAATEITDLENNGVFKAALSGTTLDNNMSDNLIYAVKLNDVSYTALTQTATSGTITLDYSAAQYQIIAPTNNISLAFSNWPASGSYGQLTIEVVVTNTAYTMTLPASVTLGLLGLAGYSGGVISFYATGSYKYAFTTFDGGTTIQIIDYDRPRNVFYSAVNIANTTTSTSTTTGALVVAGGVGIGANLNVAGNLKTYTTAGNLAFSALSTGFVTVNAPVVAANTGGALNIVGSSDGSYQPIYNAGSMFHVTGNDGVATRSTFDTFGTGNAIQSSMVLRLARGTAAAPTAVQSGDILGRITGSGYGNASNYILATGNIGTLGIDFVAMENYTTVAAGSALKFYTSPIGAVTKTLSANVTANVTTFPGNVSVTGSVNTANISLTGNVLSALNVTGNITGGNISATSHTGTTVSVTGNVITSAGNILISAGTGGVGYTTGTGGTVTQSGGGGKTAAVTLNKQSGEITTNNTNLAAATIVSFLFTNSTIGANDLLLMQHQSGGTLGSYTLNASCAAGNATVYVRNNTAGGLAEALVIRYAVVKGAVA